MDENPKNDSQGVQPDTNEQPSDAVDTSTETVNPEIEALKRELSEKDEQIASLSKLKRELKKEVRAKKSDGDEAPINNKSDDFDYGQLAYLETKGIQENEIDFVREEMSKAGVELKELVTNEYFQAKLKKHRDIVAVRDATPSNTRSSGESPSTKAEYWINKGENPPNTPENQALRREIVNKKLAMEKQRSQFAN